jgi:hypothetical protein
MRAHDRRQRASSEASIAISTTNTFQGIIEFSLTLVNYKTDSNGTIRLFDAQHLRGVCI